ncbi:hypothetical protein AB6A40_006797 [Gnathostoma spinigerum]|uniref:AMP-dependent synthetase/ligase domain-containing protein n=1 Tax=Gnathostoma spinigerum TaxID=75299 RepID=A0ABD6EJL7_9BILA
MEPGRDSWWRDLFLETSQETKNRVNHSADDADVVMVYSNRSLDGTTNEMSQKTLENNMKNFATHLQKNSLCFVVCTRNCYFNVAAMFAVLYAGCRLLIYDGPVIHPDPSRVFQIINKYKANTLIVDSDDLLTSMKHKEYTKIWDISSLTNIVVFGGTDCTVTARSIFSVPCQYVNQK